MTAAHLAAFQARATESLAGLFPGTITISGTDYAAAVIVTRDKYQNEVGGWVQLRRLTAEVAIEDMALSVVVDTSHATKPVRNLTLTYAGTTYRLTDANADPSGTCLILRAEHKHTAP